MNLQINKEMIESESLFSRQFCGQHSYGLDDLTSHIQQLPPRFARDTHHCSLDKPQGQFADKIDNSLDNEHAKNIFEKPFDLHSINIKGLQLPK